MAKDPNINLTASSQTEPLLQHIIRQDLDNGIVELRLRGAAPVLLQYLKATSIRIDILPIDEFEQLTADMGVDNHNSDRSVREVTMKPFNLIEVDIAVLTAKQDQYTLHINIDPVTPGNVIHRYSLSGHNAAAATSITRQGDPAMSMYEYTRSDWIKHGDSVQVTADRDVIGVQNQKGIGNWRLYVYSTNGNDYEYDLEGVFRGRLKTDIASIANDISGGA